MRYLLKSLPPYLFDYVTLMDRLKPYRSPHAKITRMLKQQEIIRVKKLTEGQSALSGLEPPQLKLEEYEEVWTGDYIFENEWQSFRTKKDRSLELTSVFHEGTPGRRKLAVKVVDIFGNDTMTIVEVTVGGKR